MSRAGLTPHCCQYREVFSSVPLPAASTTLPPLPFAMALARVKTLCDLRHLNHLAENKIIFKKSQ